MHSSARKKVAVIAGGLPYERDLILKAQKDVLDAVRELGFQTQLFGPLFDLDSLRSFDPIAAVILDPFFGVGETVRDIRVQLEEIGCPYTGSSPSVAAICKDKVICKEYFRALNIPTPRHSVTSRALSGDAMERAIREIPPPVIVKPLNEGSGTGLTLCRDTTSIRDRLAAELNTYPTMLIEEYVSGSDATVAVIGSGVRAKALEPVEFELTAGFQILDYAAKRAPGYKIHAPARYGEEVTEKLLSYSERVHNAIGCKGLSRIDFRVDGSRVVCLEINAQPGLGKSSFLPAAWRASGRRYATLFQSLIDDAINQ